MIAFTDPVSRHWLNSTTITVTSSYNGATSTATASNWQEREYTTPYVIIYSGSGANYAPAPSNIFEGVEPMWRRRWRLSLEAIARHRRAARRVRLRTVSQWRRPVSVARTCSQAERWRVLA